jgi:hypothetical protein
VPEPPPLGHLTAALSGHADVTAMTEVLTATLADLLPAGLVRVERERSLSDRVRGRAGSPVAVTVPIGDRELTLRRRADGSTEPEIGHVVRGVALSRTVVPIDEWITALARELERRAAADERARAALDRLLLG